MGKSSKDKRDAYYRLAKEQSWRARSAFKLLHLDEHFDLFGSDVTRVVDLCAAPGSWSQVLSRVLVRGECLGRRAWTARMKRERKAVYHGLEGLDDGLDPNEEVDMGDRRPRNNVKIVAVDLQPIASLEGVQTLIADITHQDTIPRILEALKSDTIKEGETETKPLVDLVISDGAPDVTGMHDLDIFIQAQLLFSALNLALRILKPGGKFISKIFRGKDVDFIYAQMRCFFEKVTCAKPRSSRASSLEAFVICEGFNMPKGFNVEELLPLGIGGQNNLPFNNLKKPQKAASSSKEEKGAVGEVDFEVSEDETEDHRWIAPFVACGDLSAWDADATYSLPKDHVSLDPVQPPINPPYKAALEERRRKGGLYGKTKQ
ncbi:uncharacterized protein KY384_002730 [Bacidia gigantensis]|uniref:uncharacterized protein n=1 Tax=Bacidia gigantensis TaxID=2732470 RepID=UPI001D05A55F|nr:uncharacterized protein KY384_002730 [Bacidia gigantensis]KAG8532852.1 hypothetical protein KY384_002730 [Bacidia gigantensis]